MIVYTIVAENYEKALEKAKAKHSQNNIQVLYQKEFPYGFFNKKWVEIGYYLKSRRTDSLPSLSKADSSYSQYLFSEVERIREILLGYDFSLWYIKNITDEFLQNRYAVQKQYTKEENNEFVFSRIEKFFKPDLNYFSSIPTILCIVTPYSIRRSRFINNLISHYFINANLGSQRKINLINIGEELSAKNIIYTYNCDNPEGFLSIVSSLVNCDNIIVNLSEKYFYDEKFYRSLEEVKQTFDNSVSVSLLLPSFVKPSQSENLANIKDYIENIFVSDTEPGGIYGNIVSISSFLSKPVVLFENSQGIFLPKIEFNY